MKTKPVLPNRLPLSRVKAGSRWMRIHGRARNALCFGPASGRPPIHRFDDPNGQFRVCYFGTNIEVCFAETFLRNPPVRILSLEDLAGRSIATAEVRRELRLVLIHGREYAGSQSWSRALWEHPDKPDGILYRSRHDDSALCVALYDRARDALRIVREYSLAEDPQQLTRLLRRYGLGLTD
jgi:hypothetical protein